MRYDSRMVIPTRALASLTFVFGLGLIGPGLLGISGCTSSQATHTPATDPSTARAAHVAPNTATRDVRVRQVTVEYGNIDTDFNRHGIVELGIQPHETFAVSVDGRRVTVKFASTYSDVPEGAWVAFINEDDRLRLARNLANAAETLGVVEGDTIRIHRLITE